MCPPLRAASWDLFTGRHIGRPLRSRSKYPSTPEERAGTEPAPYGSTGSADLRADVPKAWLPPTIFRSEIWGVGHRHRPLRKDGERIPSSPAGPQPPIPRNSGMVSKGRAEALPLVVSRRAWEGNRNPSRNFSWGSPLDRQRAPPAGRAARCAGGFPPSRPRGAEHPRVPKGTRPARLPAEAKASFPCKNPGESIDGGLWLRYNMMLLCRIVP